MPDALLNPLPILDEVLTRECFSSVVVEVVRWFSQGELLGKMMLQVIIIFGLVTRSLNQLEGSGTCYSSRECLGYIVSTAAGGGQCCAPGGGLSYTEGRTCQECFSMEDFISESSDYYTGIFGNFEPSPFFRIGLFRLAMLPASLSSSSFTLSSPSGTTNFNSNDRFVQTSLRSLENMVLNGISTDKSILVQSQVDRFSLVAYNEEFSSADAYKVLPCVRLPVKQYYEYYTVSVPIAKIPIVLDDYESDYVLDSNFEPIQGNSVFLIVTCEADTELNITLTQDSSTLAGVNRFVRGIPKFIELSESGSTLLLSSENDLSGSRIISNKPVTVISGHECGSVPYDQNYCDHMAEQIPPTVTWGKEFLTAPIRGRSAYDIFKVIAAEGNTTVDFFCNSDYSSIFKQIHLGHNGDYANVSVNSSMFCYVSSNMPVLLVQLAVGSTVDKMAQGDPFMVVIPPIEQYKSNYNLWMFNNSNNLQETFYVNILVPDGVDTSGLLMNGNTLDNAIVFKNVRSGGQQRGRAAQVKISEGYFTFNHSNPLATFNVIAYWNSFRTGSGYFGGMTQKPISIPSVSFDSSTYDAFENETVVVVRCTITGSLSQPSDVRVSALPYLQDSPAQVGDDFLSFRRSFTIMPGESELQIPITLIDDVFPEKLEKIEVLLHNSAGVFIDTPSKAVVSILNDDPDILVTNVSFSALFISAQEGQGIVGLNLIKTDGAVGPVSVQLNTMDGTAVAREDYVAINDTITFEVDELLKSVFLIIVDDNAVEDVENLQVSVTPVLGQFPVAVQNNTATIIIADNDIAVIGFHQYLYIVKEATDIVIPVGVLFGDLDRSVFVTFSVDNGSAVGGEDFIVQDQLLLTFDYSIRSYNATISIINDGIVESDETFTCNIQLYSREQNVMIFQSTAEIIIQDSDIAIIAITSNAAAMEGRQNARLEFQLSQGSISSNVSVRIRTANIDARANMDYVPINTVNDLNELLSNELIIEAINDDVYEGSTDEKFLVIAEIVSGGHNGRVTIQPSSIEISIQDDDLQPDARIGFSRSSYTVSEGGGEISLVVESNGLNRDDITLSYRYDGGTAQDSVDAALKTDNFVLHPQSTTAIIEVVIIDDSIAEVSEDFFIQLLPASGVELVIERARITILDNDAVQVLFEESSYNTLEGGQLTVEIQKRGQVAVPIDVSFSVSSGTALAMMDFLPVTRTLTFGPGVDTMVETIDILSDDTNEGTGEFFLLKLTPLTNVVEVLSNQSLATVTIEESAVLLSMPALTCAASGTEVINCSWTKPAAEIVNNYLLTWNYLGPCNPDSQSFLQQGSDRELELTNLEEGGNYEISLMAINSLQRGPAAKVSVSTSMASPVGFPRLVRSTSVTSNAITLEWAGVDCLEQNGRINQYTVSYESGRTGVMMVVTSNMEVTLTGLLSDEQYTVKVAASNDVGIGPFSPALVLLVPIAEINECALGTHNCDSNANCIDTRATFTCICRNGFEGNGTTCREIKGCSLSPCDDNALCTDLGSRQFSCTCTEGYSGNGFQCTDINECASFPCASEGSICLNTEGSFSCQCLIGYSGNGFTCLDVDECSGMLHNCHGAADCVNIQGSFECLCQPGFQGNGTLCEDIDECALAIHNCDRNAYCNNTRGTFTCTCRTGFEGNGTTCTEIPGCSLDPCGDNANCTDLEIGRFSCTCMEGYSGDGLQCTDVDECTRLPCAAKGSRCFNTEGSFGCMCLSGYFGNGFTCLDVDECGTNAHNCHGAADCVNTPGSFECQCQSGYQGNGISCADVDECSTGQHDCDSSAQCVNTLGGFRCDCFPGFANVNRSLCRDINECVEDKHDCHAMASCTNYRGGFTCTCLPGYQGNGTHCQVSPPVIGFEATSYIVPENETRPVCVSVLSDQDVTESIFVTVISVDGSAASSQDYYPVSQEIELSAGARNACVSVFALADILTEREEYFILMLMSSMLDVELNPFVANVTIQNTQTDFVIGFSQLNFIASGGVVEASYDVMTGNARSNPLTISVQTSDGNATAGVDYTPVSRNIVVIVANEQRSITVNILDSTGESTKIFFITITSVGTFGGESYGLNQVTATAIIPSRQPGK